MTIIETEGHPNFIVTCRVGENGYRFRFHTFRGMLYCDVTVNAVELVRSVRCVNDAWLVPYFSGQDGNFRCESETENYPTGTGMGKTCNLVYYTSEEIEVL